MLSDKKNCNRIETELQSLRPNYKVCVLFLFLELSLCSSVHSDYKVAVSFLFLDIILCSCDHIPHQTEANCNVQVGGVCIREFQSLSGPEKIDFHGTARRMCSFPGMRTRGQSHAHTDATE